MSNRDSFPSRRALLGCMPLGALTAIPIALTEVDPIFDKIAAVKKTNEAYGETCPLTDIVAAKNEGRSITPDDQAVVAAASATYQVALDELLASTPTTLPGVKAFVGFLLDESICYDWDHVDSGLNAILRSPVFGGEHGN